MTSSALPLRIQPSRLPRSRASARPRKTTRSRSGLTNTRTISSSPRRLRVHHFGTGISAGGAAHQREHRYQVETSHPASQQCLSTRDSPSPDSLHAPGLGTLYGLMDPLAHTLVGAALGRAVSDRRIPWAGLLGAIAGNAPDWTEPIVTPPFWTPRSGPAYLLYHRGITHSFAGAAVLIVGLTAVAGLLLRWLAARRGAAPPPWRPRRSVPRPFWTPRSGPAYLLYHRGITHSFAGAAVLIVGLTAVAGLLLRWLAARRGAAPPPWRWIAACVAAGVMSHLYLDWQGSYGVRPLLPWNATWYYADWVAIVDPFFWMLPLIALAWGARRHWAPALAYGFALAGVEALVLWGWRAAGVALWVWLVGVAPGGAGVLGWGRHRVGGAGGGPPPAHPNGALPVYSPPHGPSRLLAQTLAPE